MPAIKFVALPLDTVRALQAGGTDFNGQLPERRISDGNGVPCRLTLRTVPAGEPYLILSYRPFPAPQPYAEVGPIFLHADSQERWPESDEIPPALASPRYIVRGYGADDRIVYGTGQIVETPAIPAKAAAMLEDDRIAYLHVRSSSNNCYQCRIERA